MNDSVINQVAKRISPSSSYSKSPSSGQAVRRIGLIFAAALLVAGAWFGLKTIQSKPASEASVVQDDTPGTDWRLDLKRPGFQRANAALALQDGGAVIVGGAFDPDNDQLTNTFYLKLSADGGVVIERSIPRQGEEEAFAVAPAPEGGVYVAGRVDYAMSVSRIDAAGYVMWRNNTPGEGGNAASVVVPTVDDGVIAVGETGGEGAVGSDVVAVRYRPDGEQVWLKRFGDPNLAETVVAGSSAGFGDIYLLLRSQADLTSARYEVAKLSRRGGLIWRAPVSLEGVGWLNAVAAKRGGGVYVAGAENTDALVVSLTDTGEEIWTRRYSPGSDDQITAIAAMSDGGFAVAGEAGRSEAPSGWVARADAKGDLVWEGTYAQDARNALTALSATPGGSLVLAGQSYAGDQSGSDLQIARVKPSSTALPSPSLTIVDVRSGARSADLRLNAPSTLSDGASEPSPVDTQAEGPIDLAPGLPPIETEDAPAVPSSEAITVAAIEAPSINAPVRVDISQSADARGSAALAVAPTPEPASAPPPEPTPEPEPIAVPVVESTPPPARVENRGPARTAYQCDIPCRATNRDETRYVLKRTLWITGPIENANSQLQAEQEVLCMVSGGSHRVFETPTCEPR